MTISQLALAAKRVIESAWLHGPSYDLASQAAFALESTQMLQSPETAAELERLRARVDELEAQRQADHETWQHDLRAARGEREATAARIAELEALKPATFQDCRVCGAGYEYGQPCSNCEFRARMAVEAAPLKGRARLDASAEAAAEATHWRRLGVEDPHDSPLHHRYDKGRDVPPIGGATC